MVLTLNNGQSITVFENQNVLRQIKDYIDEEIYKLLEYKYGFLENNMNNLYILNDFDDLEGRRVKYCSVAEYDYSYFCTFDGAILMFRTFDDEFTSEICDENRFKQVLLNYEWIRNDLINHNVISTQCIDEIKREQAEKNKAREEAYREEEKKRKYNEYIKLKAEFEGGK
ncbi:hypothetical protein [Clostridium sp. VAP52]|uniref:hypothetical protein n=1 Tax=Clostridium sp. VAP52 TaxID=2949977 RepID=UPI002079544D|nr:hypothetical protein [Clostridium sp. VAP52]